MTAPSRAPRHYCAPSSCPPAGCFHIPKVLTFIRFAIYVFHDKCAILFFILVPGTLTLAVSIVQLFSYLRSAMEIIGDHQNVSLHISL